MATSFSYLSILSTSGSGLSRSRARRSCASACLVSILLRCSDMSFMYIIMANFVTYFTEEMARSKYSEYTMFSSTDFSEADSYILTPRYLLA